MNSSYKTLSQFSIKRAFAQPDEIVYRRQIYETLGTPSLNLQKRVLDLLDWQGNETVLDIGCGPGTYWPELRDRIPDGIYIAGDTSMEMVRSAHSDDRRVRATQMNVKMLPLATDSVDVVMANHLFEYVDNLGRAFGAVRRVLRDDGILIATGNSIQTMPQIVMLLNNAINVIGRIENEEYEESTIIVPYSLDNASALLTEHFDVIVRYDYPNKLLFKDADILVQFIRSSRHLMDFMLPAEISWKEFMKVMELQIQMVMSEQGNIEVEKHTGVIIASNNADAILKTLP